MFNLIFEDLTGGDGGKHIPDERHRTRKTHCREKVRSARGIL